MRRLFKLLIKVTKVYLIFDVICIALIGASELFEEYHNNPDVDVSTCNRTVFKRAKERFKNYFK